MWKIEYDNDTGHSDEWFWEWWDVTDGTKSFRCSSQEEADWLCNHLNLTTGST
jgi:hypothetical protein